jgi:hypothetical protein
MRTVGRDLKDNWMFQMISGVFKTSILSIFVDKFDVI